MQKKFNIAIITVVVGILLLAFGLWYFSLNRFEGGYGLLPVSPPKHYNGQQFAGSESCIPCHESIFKTHVETAHHNTSGWGTEENVIGNFNSEDDFIDLIGSRVKMLKKSDGFYQRTIDFASRETEDNKVDVVIGSGVKGQSHLSFEGDSLYQLQASYLTLTDGWINSPGFPNFIFKRPVMDNCIKCHVTFAENKSFSGNTNIYKKESYLLGIECERCHGPSQSHVNFHKSGKSASQDPMLDFQTLNRELRIDACAQCHGGLRANQLKENPFSYVVGEKLDDYAKNFNSGRPQAELDVHGNQVGLLKSSPCYKKSEAMDCTTCHNPHQDQRGNERVFNAKCMECHNGPQEFHTAISADASWTDQNCIGCHMPLFPSRTMKVKLPADDKEKSVAIRTHLIGVYIDSILQ